MISAPADRPPAVDGIVGILLPFLTRSDAMKPRLALLAALSLFAHPSAFAVEIDQPWARATPPGSTLSAAFMTLRSSDDQGDRLLAASSSSAARVEIHETRMVGDVMQMRQLEQGVAIDAGSAVELQPGGMHIMLLDLPAPLLAGQSLSLTLHFEHAGEIVVEVPIRAPGDQDAADEHEHHHH
jgi:hypothetical protein